MKTIFYSGPLFTTAEIEFNRLMAEDFTQKGYKVFLPQAECENLEGRSIFETCRTGILESDVVVACVDGADADSGTCWECGFAVGQKKPLIIFRTDFRQTGDTGGFNAMLYYSAEAAIEANNVKTLCQEIHQAIHRIIPSTD